MHAARGALCVPRARIVNYIFTWQPKRDGGKCCLICNDHYEHNKNRNWNHVKCTEIIYVQNLLWSLRRLLEMAFSCRSCFRPIFHFRQISSSMFRFYTARFYRLHFLYFYLGDLPSFTYVAYSMLSSRSIRIQLKHILWMIVCGLQCAAKYLTCFCKLNLLPIRTLLHFIHITLVDSFSVCICAYVGLISHCLQENIFYIALE